MRSPIHESISHQNQMAVDCTRDRRARYRDFGVEHDIPRHKNTFRLGAAFASPSRLVLHGAIFDRSWNFL